MKMRTKITVLAIVLNLSQPVFAASQADLTVMGSVAPAPCTVVIAGGKDYRFGTMMADELNSDAPTHRDLSKTISIECPAPTGLWVAFPFDNGGQLKPHAGGTATGSLAWWKPSTNEALPDGGCDPVLPDAEQTKVDVGDGNLMGLDKFVRIFRGRVFPLSCPVTSFSEYVSDGNGAEDGFYLGHPAVKRMQIPRHLRMSINPRDDLDTAGAIQLEGAATVVVNYF